MEQIGTQKIETECLILRKFTKEDSQEIFEGFRNQEEFLYYTNKKPVSLEKNFCYNDTCFVGCLFFALI